MQPERHRSEILELERPFSETIRLKPDHGFLVPGKRIAIVLKDIGLFNDTTLRARLAFVAPPNIRIARRKVLEVQGFKNKVAINKSITTLVMGIRKYKKDWPVDEVFVEDDSIKVMEFINPLTSKSEVLLSYSSPQPRAIIPFGPISDIDEVKDKLARL